VFGLSADIADFAKMNKVYASSSATINPRDYCRGQVSPAAMLVEIDCVAYKPVRKTKGVNDAIRPMLVEREAFENAVRKMLRTPPTSKAEISRKKFAEAATGR
jgi:hypothetical protein